MAAGKIIIPGEDPAEFEALLAALEEDHQPQTSTESILDHDLVKFHWLKERAIRLQQQAFFTVEAMDPRHLALMMTYQNSFQRTLESLETMKKERVKTEEKSVSQTPKTVIFGCTDPVWDARIKLREAERQLQEAERKAGTFTDPPGNWPEKGPFC